jgi:hypothetical protein
MPVSLQSPLSLRFPVSSSGSLRLPVSLQTPVSISGSLRNPFTSINIPQSLRRLQKPLTNKISKSLQKLEKHLATTNVPKSLQKSLTAIGMLPYTHTLDNVKVSTSDEDDFVAINISSPIDEEFEVIIHRTTNLGQNGILSSPLVFTENEFDKLGKIVKPMSSMSYVFIYSKSVVWNFVKYVKSLFYNII